MPAAMLSRALNTHLEVVQCADLSWWSCRSCHHHPECAEHPDFPTLPHHMSVHCSATEPITELATCSTALIQDVSFQFHFFRGSITLFIAISAILTLKIFFKIHLRYMKTCSLLMTKSEENPVFPNP